MVFKMNTRINVNIPKSLFQQASQLVKGGYFSNFSELVREGLRKEVAFYQKDDSQISNDERKLFAMLKKADEQGLLVNEKEMKKHGLKVSA